MLELNDKQNRKMADLGNKIRSHMRLLVNGGISDKKLVAETMLVFAETLDFLDEMKQSGSNQREIFEIEKNRNKLLKTIEYVSEAARASEEELESKSMFDTATQRKAKVISLDS